MNNVSATQVDAFRRCQRYWHVQWIQGQRVAPTPAMERGTKLHKTLELALRGEVPPETMLLGEIGPLYAAQFEALDKTFGAFDRSADVLVEHRIDLPTWQGGPRWIGYVDLALPLRTPPLVVDHKALSNFRYAKTPEELKRTVQMSSYAWWGFHHLGPYAHHAGLLGTGTAYARTVGETVEIGHLYVQTGVKKPKTLWRSAVMSHEEASAEWRRSLDTVRAMERAAVVENEQDLPPTLESCDLYGGCPFRARCGLSPKSFKEAFAMSNASQNPPGNGLAAAGHVVPLAERLRQARNPAPAAGQAAPVGAQGVTPPDAPPRDQRQDPSFVPPGTSAPATESPLAQKLKRTRRPKAEAAPPPVSPPDPAAEIVAAAAAAGEVLNESEIREMIAELGIDEVVRMVADMLPPPAVPPPKPAAPATPPVRQAVAAVAAVSASELELFIDCWPIKGSAVAPTLFEDWIGPVHAEAARRAGVADYRLLPYGQCKSLIADVLRGASKAVPACMVVPSSAEGAKEALEVLIPQARRVVKALRG